MMTSACKEETVSRSSSSFGKMDRAFVRKKEGQAEAEEETVTSLFNSDKKSNENSEMIVL